MNTVFESAIIKHTSGKPNSFKAAMKVLPAEGFASATEEISQWQGYEPTPLFSLKNISSNLSLSEVLYKDEGPRFGLISRQTPFRQSTHCLRYSRTKGACRSRCQPPGRRSLGLRRAASRPSGAWGGRVGASTST